MGRGFFLEGTVANLPSDAMQHPAHQPDETDFISAFDKHPAPLPTHSTTSGARAMSQSPGTIWSILLWQHKLTSGADRLPTGAFIYDTTIETSTTATNKKTRPIYQTLADYRGLTFPGQCELLWRSIVACIVHSKCRPESVLLPSSRFVSVLGPFLERRLEITSIVWIVSLVGMDLTWLLSDHTPMKKITNILSFEDDKVLCHTTCTALQVQAHAAQGELKKLNKKCKKGKMVKVPKSWFVVPKGSRGRHTLCWGWRTNLEIAVKRGDADVVEIIANAPPRSMDYLDYMAHVWIMCEARILLRRAAERGLLDVSVVLLDACHVTVDGIGYGKTPFGSKFLRGLQEDAGSQGMTPLLVCCHPEDRQTESTKQQKRLEGVTEEKLNQVGLMLLERGADPIAPAWPQNNGVTPIFMAALNIKMELVRVMLQNPNVDPSEPIGDGKSAISLLTSIVETKQYTWKTCRSMLRLLKGKDNGKTSTATQKMCERCFKSDPSKKCACGTVRYCSAECQRDHWPVHKKTCQARSKTKKVKQQKKRRKNGKEKGQGKGADLQSCEPVANPSVNKSMASLERSQALYQVSKQKLYPVSEQEIDDLRELLLAPVAATPPPAPTPPAFTKGQIIVLSGLVSKPEWNGRRAIVLAYLPDRQRYSLSLSRNNTTLAAKPSNMSVYDVSGVWDAIEFWPQESLAVPTDIPMSPVQGWPTDWTKEDQFLRSQGWCQPMLQSFAGCAASKPDFMMYYDKADTTSSLNELGNLILRGVPQYKLPTGPCPIIRGKVVVVYAPTTIGGELIAPLGPKGTKFSVAQMQDILHWFTRTVEVATKKAQMDSPLGVMGF